MKRRFLGSSKKEPADSRTIRYIVELEQVDERMYMSKASPPAVHKHQRLPICAEGAVGFHKRVKRIHDPMKIVVPCAVFEVEFPIPPDKDKSGGKKRRNWKKRKRTKGGSQLPLIPHSSDGVRKSRVCSKCFSQPLEKLRVLLISKMIDKGEESMEEVFTKE
ncbi:hypothetical protein DY000_02052913 [Brassica cretica]|uniref:Uncharacterized protein n=1 Tax=Brassica cretica TaxID=69181 RepID=A0ABQ7AIE2_BRACR|nr:hypothetical protein DY000_02052913 [Brassica cretica]